MKKIIAFFFVISLLLPSYANAQDTDKINNQIDQLKNKVASKVAQLNLVEKKGVIGKVVEVGTNSLSIEDINENQIEITTDELTDYTSDENSSFGFSDIKKGSELSILGLYNKDSHKILARFVDESAIPLFLSGVITDKDAKNSTLTLVTSDGTSYIVDDEDVTKDLTFDKNNIVTTSFSKFPTQVNALVVGFSIPKDKNRITAGRIIVFPDMPKNPDIPIVKDESPTTSK